MYNNYNIVVFHSCIRTVYGSKTVVSCNGHPWFALKMVKFDPSPKSPRICRMDLYFMQLIIFIRGSDFFPDGLYIIMILNV